LENYLKAELTPALFFKGLLEKNDGDDFLMDVNSFIWGSSA
jgi:hypothetical protein